MIFFFVEHKGLFTFIVGILTYIYLYLIIKKEAFFEEILNIIQERINKLEENKKGTYDFLSYLTAYRQLEAKEYGYSIYPDIRVNDSIYVVNKYKDKYEEKRVEYEKNHIEFLKLNKHYLDEKLKKAPITSYPIVEQKLLKDRKQELSNSSFD